MKFHPCLSDRCWLSRSSPLSTPVDVMADPLLVPLRLKPSMNEINIQDSSNNNESMSNQHRCRPSSSSPKDLGVDSKTFILYLEPSRESQFYQSIQEFFYKSQLDVGLNEAHMV